MPIAGTPDCPEALQLLLRHHGLDGRIRKAAGLEDVSELRPIGRLDTTRSRHTYALGMRKLELTWDLVRFPEGDHEVRVEVEVKGAKTERYLGRADRELRGLFDGQLRPAKRGKVRELCRRRYPALL